MKITVNQLLLLVLPLCLAACTSTNPISTNFAIPPAVVTATPEVTPTLEGKATPEPTLELATDPVAEAIFPRSFSFLSGAGGWSTELEVAPDGSFVGNYHDSDMGDRDEGSYPYGTMYICNFSGQFSQPEKVDEYTYRVELECIETEETEGEETIEDGVRYVSAGPYGLTGADEILIYLPGAWRGNLPEGFVNWTYTFDPWDEEGRLTNYGLYNVAEEQGFVGTGLVE